LDGCLEDKVYADSTLTIEELQKSAEKGLSKTRNGTLIPSADAMRGNNSCYSKEQLMFIVIL
jgi:hypothetical protein